MEPAAESLLAHLLLSLFRKSISSGLSSLRSREYLRASEDHRSLQASACSPRETSHAQLIVREASVQGPLRLFSVFDPFPVPGPSIPESRVSGLQPQNPAPEAPPTLWTGFVVWGSASGVRDQINLSEG